MVAFLSNCKNGFIAPKQGGIAPKPMLIDQKQSELHLLPFSGIPKPFIVK